MTDFDFYCDGSVCTLTPRTPEAADWCDENLPEDALMFGNAYVIETNYMGEIADGLEAAGLTIG